MSSDQVIILTSLANEVFAIKEEDIKSHLISKKILFWNKKWSLLHQKWTIWRSFVLRAINPFPRKIFSLDMWTLNLKKKIIVIFVTAIFFTVIFLLKHLLKKLIYCGIWRLIPRRINVISVMPWFYDFKSYFNIKSLLSLLVKGRDNLNANNAVKSFIARVIFFYILQALFIQNLHELVTLFISSS